MKWLILLLLPACSSSSSSPQAKNLGVVALQSQSYTSSGVKYGSGSITANFLRQQVDPNLGCAQKTFGDCVAHFSCQPVLDRPVDDAGLQPYASAGEIDVSGLAIANQGMTTPIMLTVMSSGTFAGQYDAYEQGTPLFAGGESITVSAVGDQVKAFSATVTAPLQPTVTSPGPNAPTVVGHAQDLSFVWSGGGSGDLLVSLVQPSTSGTPGIDCSWPVSAGAGKIPSAALSLFAVGSASFSLSVASSSTLTVADWQVQVAAGTAPLQDGGGAYQTGSVTLQ